MSRIKKFMAERERQASCLICDGERRKEIDADLREWVKLRDAGTPDIGRWHQLLRFLNKEHGVTHSPSVYLRHTTRHLKLDPGVARYV